MPFRPAIALLARNLGEHPCLRGSPPRSRGARRLRSGPPVPAREAPSKMESKLAHDPHRFAGRDVDRQLVHSAVIRAQTDPMRPHGNRHLPDRGVLSGVAAIDEDPRPGKGLDHEIAAAAASRGTRGATAAGSAAARQALRFFGRQPARTGGCRRCRRSAARASGCDRAPRRARRRCGRTGRRGC